MVNGINLCAQEAARILEAEISSQFEQRCQIQEAVPVSQVPSMSTLVNIPVIIWRRTSHLGEVIDVQADFHIEVLEVFPAT